MLKTCVLAGFDGSAHVSIMRKATQWWQKLKGGQMTEETHNAAMSGSIGIITAIGVSAVLG